MNISKLKNHTINKFLLLGVVSTLIDYMIYTLAIENGVLYIYAIILGYSIGLLVNFIVGRYYVFTNGIKVKNSYVEFLWIVLIAIGGVLINIFIVKYLSYSNSFALDPLLSRVIAIAIVFFWNYFCRKYFVYH